VRGAGFGGLGMLLDTLAEHPGGPVHTVSAVRVGGPGRFQIDHQHGVKRPKTIACDGQRRWVVYGDRMTVGPARQPPSDVADLADASWLLECRIAGGALIMAGDRPAYRLDVARGDAPWLFFMFMFPSAAAVVDAELGIILSLTSYLGGKPVRRYELRDVTSGPGDFRVDLPSGLHAEPEPDRPAPWGMLTRRSPRSS
jgi:hypothetical protein